MRKALLLLILGLSINVLAQNKPTGIQLLLPTAGFPYNVLSRMEDRNSNISGTGQELNGEQTVEDNAFNMRSEIPLYDSIYTFQLDLNNNHWNAESKFTDFIYDANNNLVSQISQTCDSLGWTKSYKNIFTYDPNNNETVRLSQAWDGNNWIDNGRVISTFDARNNKTSYLIQSWSGYWRNNSILTFVYDTNDNLIIKTEQAWQEGAWANQFLNSYAYDASNNRVSTSCQRWDGSAWEKYVQASYIFDSNNNQTSGYSLLWHGTYWVNYFHTFNTYDENFNCTNELYLIWKDSSWVNYEQIIYAYDANNNPINKLDQYWHGAWLNNSQSSSEYDANNFRESFSSRGWDATGTVLAYVYNTYYYFRSVLGINNLAVKDEIITINPNPSSGQFRINSIIPFSAIEIYNLHGKQVYSDIDFNPQLAKEVNLSAFPKGIYMVNVRCGTESYTRKILVQ